MKLTKSERALFDAVTKGNLKQVKTLMKKVSDLDYEGDYGRTPLEQAIFKKQLPVVKALVEGGADINRINEYDQTPLDVARAYGETKIATWLKAEGAYKAKDKPRFSYGSSYDDDDDYFGRSFDDDDDWGTSKRTTAQKSRATAKKTSRAFTNSAAEGGTGAAKPEKPTQPVQPKFTEETLKDTFNAKNWVGRTEDMEKLWEEVPVKLQKKFDFDTALAEAKRETLRKNAPAAPKLSLAPAIKTAENNPPPPPGNKPPGGGAPANG